MKEVVPSPLVDDRDADPELRAWLAEARASAGASDADLSRFAKRFAPLVAVELMASAQLAPVAPASPPGLEALGKAAALHAPAAPAAVAKPAAVAGAKLLSGSAALKLGAASLALGASVWLARDARPVPAAVVAAPVVAAVSSQVEPLPVAPAPSLEPAPRLAPEPSAARPAARRRAVRVEAPDELGLIREAQAHRGEPAQVLARLAEHRKFYPNGLLAQEREVLAVEALVQAGRRADAVTRARAFMAAFPSSVHLARLRSLLGAALAE